MRAFDMSLINFPLSKDSRWKPQKKVDTQPPNPKTATTKRDYVLLLTMLLAIVASVVSCFYFYQQGLITAFRDGEARLIISRFVVDSNNQGVTNLAGNWPPSPHSEWVIFIWNDFLFHSGLAGAIPSMFWYMVSVFFLYKMIVRLTNDQWAGFVGVVAFSAVNLLYMQATPMSEVPFIGRVLMCGYFLTRWVQNTDKWYFLFLAGLAVCWATLTRYESWGLLPIVLIIVVLTGLTNKFGWEKIHAYLHVIGPVAISGIVFWLGVNWVIFGDPFFFARSEFSAGQIAERTFNGLDPSLRTEGNLFLDAKILSRSSIDIIGLPVIVLALLGMIKLLFSKRTTPEKLVGLTLAYPIAFYLITMYVGFSTVIWHPDYFNGQNWGTRYLTLMLPAVGLFTGFLVAKHGIWLKLPILTVLVASSVMTAQSGLLTVNEAKTYPQDPSTAARNRLAVWLDSHYDRGLILLFRVGNERVIFTSTVPLDKLVYEGSEPKFWHSALENPVEKHIDWIIMRSNLNGKPDLVWQSLKDTDILAENYYLAYTDEEVVVYKIIPGRDVKSQERLSSGKQQGTP